jgi:trypsin-like peptidase
VEVRRVLARADLALMKVADDASLPILVEHAMPPAPEENLKTWGYPETVRKLRSAVLRVADGGAILRDNVPASLDKVFQDAGMSLDTRVVAIQDAIAPGFSGAPLLDAQGRVRAIANGGVNHGITGVAWAISAVHLTELARSTEQISAYVGVSAHQSAAEGLRAATFERDLAPAERDGPTVKCGPVYLTRVRTVKAWDAASAADAPGRVTRTLQQLQAWDATLSQALRSSPQRFRLDVWEDLKSGAAVAVPAGLELTDRGTYCGASGESGTMIVQVTPVPGWVEPDVVPAQFERLAKSIASVQWIGEPPEPKFLRPDGMLLEYRVFRESDDDARARAPGLPAGVRAPPDGILVETLAMRNGTFMGVAATHAGCRSSLPCSFHAQWLSMAASVEVSTFAISASRRRGLTRWQQN